MEATDLPFTCNCGSVRGTLLGAGPEAGDHVVCHCTDCQAFATRLAQAGRILDATAGTALYQTRCAKMRITAGADRLACLHLTDKPTLRWYAACCDTPMFNTYRSGRVPYITTLVANADPAGRNRLGPPVGHLFTNEGTGDTGDLKPMSMSAMMRRFFPRMIADILAGDRKRSALFDPLTLEPIATPVRIATQAGSIGPSPPSE